MTAHGQSMEARFWTKVQIGGPDECWPWNGTTNRRNGYGQISVEGRTRRAHRASFYLTNGYWPLVCRHTCDYKLCVNPAHLLDGTLADNNRDMAERGRARNGREAWTHCPEGHEFTVENTYVNPTSGKRKCRTCTRERMRDWRALLKAGQVEQRPRPHDLRTHCSHGHEYTSENTYVEPNTGHRVCRACNRRGSRLYRARQTT